MNKQPKNIRNKKRQRQKGSVTHALLTAIKAAGFLSVALLAPNTMKALEQLGIATSSSTDDRIYFRRATTRLKQRGLITFKKNKGRTYIQLTEKGQRELVKFQLREKKIKKPFLWDGRYRVLIFDIKEKQRSLRDKLRRELENLDFYMIQQSVWVYPYNCEDIIILLKSYLHLGNDVVYMVVERIENDQRIVKHFRLI